jgi:hypothetical protein
MEVLAAGNWGMGEFAPNHFMVMSDDEAEQLISIIMKCVLSQTAKNSRKYTHIRYHFYSNSDIIHCLFRSTSIQKFKIPI